MKFANESKLLFIRSAAETGGRSLLNQVKRGIFACLSYRYYLIKSAANSAFAGRLYTSAFYDTFDHPVVAAESGVVSDKSLELGVGGFHLTYVDACFPTVIPPVEEGFSDEMRQVFGVVSGDYMRAFRTRPLIVPAASMRHREFKYYHLESSF